MTNCITFGYFHTAHLKSHDRTNKAILRGCNLGLLFLHLDEIIRGVRSTYSCTLHIRSCCVVETNRMKTRTRLCLLTLFWLSLLAHEHHLKHIRRHCFPHVSRLYEVGDRMSQKFQAVRIANLSAISERSIEWIQFDTPFTLNITRKLSPLVSLFLCLDLRALGLISCSS